MVAECGVELYAAVKQTVIWEFKFFSEIIRPVPSVNIVPKHNYEIELHSLVVEIHLLRNFILCRLAGPAVADHSKTDLLGYQGQLDFNRSIFGVRLPASLSFTCGLPKWFVMIIPAMDGRPPNAANENQ